MLQKLFPKQCHSISDFHCETCEYAKHCCSPYSPSMSRSTTLLALVHSNMCYSPTMITPRLLGFTYWNPRMRFFRPFNCFTNWSKLNLPLNSKFFIRIMVGNICLMPFHLISLSMVSFIKPFVLVFLSKMELLREKIGTFLRITIPYFFTCMFHKIFWANALQTTAYVDESYAFMHFGI